MTMVKLQNILPYSVILQTLFNKPQGMLLDHTTAPLRSADSTDNDEAAEIADLKSTIFEFLRYW